MCTHIEAKRKNEQRHVLKWVEKKRQVEINLGKKIDAEGKGDKKRILKW